MFLGQGTQGGQDPTSLLLIHTISAIPVGNPGKIF